MAKQISTGLGVNREQVISHQSKWIIRVLAHSDQGRRKDIFPLSLFIALPATLLYHPLSLYTFNAGPALQAGPVGEVHPT